MLYCFNKNSTTAGKCGCPGYQFQQENTHSLIITPRWLPIIIFNHTFYFCD